MKFGFLAVIAAFAPLAACTPGQKIALENPDKMKLEDTETLCRAAAYNIARTDALFTELLRRQAIRPQFVGAIKNTDAVVGMNICELHAAVGLPTGVNETSTRAGTTLQLVYDYGAGHPLFVYVENGTVTAVQNHF